MAGKLRTALGILFVGALLGNAACSGDTGPAGPPGPKGDPGGGAGGGGGGVASSISAVIPADGFTGRTFDVTISGSGTEWTSGVKVDFGKDVTVNKVTVASPTALVVNISTDAKADLTVRDVSVDSDAYKGVFQLKSPLQITSEIPIDQGGYVLVHAQILDPTTILDSTTLGLTQIDGVTIQPTAATTNSLDFYAQVDMLAAPGSYDFLLSSGTGADKTDSFLKGGLVIKARAPITLASGDTKTAPIDTGSDTGLFSFTPVSSALQFVAVDVTDPSSTGLPIGNLIPKSGKWSDVLGGGQRFFFSTSSTDVNFIDVFDGFGIFGYDAQVDLLATPVTGATETEPNDTLLQASSVATLPGLVQAASIADGTDIYSFTATAGATLHVVTAGEADTTVEILDPAGTSIAGPTDDAVGEEVTASATLAGTYFVKVTQGSEFDSSAPTYDLFVELP